jgi:hypothetical protein
MKIRARRTEVYTMHSWKSGTLYVASVIAEMQTGF